MRVYFAAARSLLFLLTRLTQEKKSLFKSYITMQLRKKDGSVEERRVIHFWLNSWPDHGRPHDAQQMLTLAAAVSGSTLNSSDECEQTTFAAPISSTNEKFAPSSSV